MILLQILKSRLNNAKLLCVGLLVSQIVYAADIPWHLGQPEGTPAPSAINAYNIKPGPNRITVAVIDSGVLSAHPSLAGQVLPGYDMLSPPNNLRGNRSSNYSPDERDAKCGGRLVSSAFRTHGTEVSSLIAGNGVDGVFGVNTNAKILPIRLFGACSMSRSDLLDALNWAGGISVPGVPDNPNPARVINMSIAGGLPVCGPDLQQTIQRLIDKKIFIVAAAGNNFHKPLPEPANCSGVISVGAVDAENKIEVYSAMDPRTVLYAPGGGKRLEGDNSWSINKLKVATYELDFSGQEKPATPFRGVGTSYAAPIVSGFVSLWLSYQPEKTPNDFWKELPKFLRDVQPITACADCIPKGLSVPVKLSQP